MNKVDRVRPFLRWIGGKTKSIPFLLNHLPNNFKPENTYYEPFLGAASLFLCLSPKSAVLSDKNRDLIECYIAIKERPELVSRYLSTLKKNTSKDYYNSVREKYNKLNNSISKSAMFIYLNKTCFNGIWRVNLNGEFNVPYGYKEPPVLPTKEHILQISRRLSNTILLHMDYQDAVKDAGKGDFIYFDPPYPPLNGTSNFTQYTKERFSFKDHKKLFQVAKLLSARGCNVLISNSNTEFIRSLYKKYFIIHELELRRWIRTDGVRYIIKEVAITNY